MKILAHCSTYGNNCSSGADKMMQSLLEYLAQRGCEVRCAIDKCDKAYRLNEVIVCSNKSMLGEQYDWCDVVIIHLVAMHEGVLHAARFNKPVIHLCHNAHVKPKSGCVIYNSQWLAQSMNLPLPSIVVHPPVNIPEGYTSHYNQPYITLVNTCENKGGKLFLDLARQAYNYRFLGIHGGYGVQLHTPLPNVMYRPYNPAGVDYSDTRIIIIPSQMESWSIVASEAMIKGIPVICSDLPGLRENCGSAAVYAQTVKDYLDAIQLLDNELTYDRIASDGFYHQRSHNYGQELNNLFNFIKNIVMQTVGKIKVDEKLLAVTSEMKEKKEIKPKKEKKEHKGLPTQK